MVSEDRRKSNQEKRDAFMQALEIVAMKTEFKQIAQIARVLSNNEEEAYKLKHSLYSIKADPPRSTPSDILAQQVYDRWPFQEVYDALSECFPIRRPDYNEQPIEMELVKSIPELVTRINQLKATDTEQRKQIAALEEEQKKLKAQLLELAKVPKYKNDKDFQKIIQLLKNG